MGWSCALAGLSETLYWIPSKGYIRSVKVIGDQANSEYEHKVLSHNIHNYFRQGKTMTIENVFLIDQANSNMSTLPQ